MEIKIAAAISTLHIVKFESTSLFSLLTVLIRYRVQQALYLSALVLY